jgi:cytosine/adenosine deaminase-related metal-dependent hydrolase
MRATSGKALTPLRISAGIIWPVSSSPIPRGALLVDESGRIVQLGPESAVPSPPNAANFSLEHAVILPGFLNLHTHLELNGLRGEIDDIDFFTWIQRVRAAKEATDEAGFLQAARAGLREAWSYGTTTVADTGTSGATAVVLKEMGGRGIYYQEAIAPDPELCDETFGSLVEVLASLARSSPEAVEVGVSPHAPYTVSAQLYALVAGYARSEGLKLAAHLAESHAEVEFVTRRTGKFARAWRDRDIPLPEAARSPVEYASRLGLLGSDLLVIHAVHTDGEDIELLAEFDVPVAVCPRSNKRHGHGAPPLAAFLEGGLRCGLGTDSVASVDSLDLLAEARKARELASLSATQAIRLLTLGGATALGRQDSLGSLEPGKWADLCVVELEERLSDDPEELASAVLQAGSEAISATYVAGRMVYSSKLRSATD